jgi:hypothetical protein
MAKTCNFHSSLPTTRSSKLTFPPRQGKVVMLQETFPFEFLLALSFCGSEGQKGLLYCLAGIPAKSVSRGLSIPGRSLRDLFFSP